MYDNRRQSSFNSSSSSNKMSSSSSSLLVDYSRGKGTSVRRGLEENNREYQRRNKLTTNLTLSMRSILMDDESIHSTTNDELSQSHHHEQEKEQDKTPITFRIRKRRHPMNRTLSCPRSMNDEATTARAARGKSRLTQSATAALQNNNNNNNGGDRRRSSMRRSRSSDDAMMMNGLDRNSSHHDRFANSIMMRNQQLDLSNPTHRGRSPSAVPLGLQKNPLQKSSHSSRSLSPATRKPMISHDRHHHRSRSPLSKSKSIQSLETNNSNHSKQQQQRRRAGLERSLSYQNYNYNSAGSSKSLLTSSLSSRSLSPKRNNSDSLDNISNHGSSSTLHHSAPSMVFAKGDSLSSLNHCSSHHFVTGSRIRRHHTGGSSRVQPHAVGA